MKANILAVSLAVGLLIPLDASAWFFFFIPGPVIDAIGDAISGAEGENCVPATARVGDKMLMPGGKVGEIRSISGSTYRCSNPDLPLRARVEVSSYSPRAPLDNQASQPKTAPPKLNTSARMQLPAGWESTLLTSGNEADGAVLNAIDRSTGSRFTLFAYKREGVTDMTAFAASKRAWQASYFNNTQQSEVVPLVVNGVPAWRYVVSGTSYSNTRYTYLHTVVDAGTDILLLSTWITADKFEEQRPAMEKLVESLTGITATIPVAAASSATASAGSAASAASEVKEVPSVVSVPQSPSTAPTTNAAQRLRNLNDIYKDGLINKKEYEEKKKQILDSL